jgi:HPt (histidine-containing phosphotransfer) domain-containing protein
VSRSSIRPDQQIHALLNTHCETLKHHIGEAERLSLQLAQRAAVDDTLRALVHVAHKIAGTGGTMGFDLLSQKAFALEMFAKKVLRNAQGSQDDAVGMIRALTRSLSNVGAGLKPEQSRLRQRLLLEKAGAR